MKVQEVKKECLANVGLSIEFSNSEVDSIVALVRTLDQAIEKGCIDLASLVDHTAQINSELERADQGAFGKTQFTPTNATAHVDLKTLTRISWLLDKLTNGRAYNPSHLFDEADANVFVTVAKINGGDVA